MLVPIVLLTIVLGVYPAPVFDVVNPAVERILEVVGVTDPVPTIGILGGEQ